VPTGRTCVQKSWRSGAQYLLNGTLLNLRSGTATARQQRSNAVQFSFIKVPVEIVMANYKTGTKYIQEKTVNTHTQNPK